MADTRRVGGKTVTILDRLKKRVKILIMSTSIKPIPSINTTEIARIGEQIYQNELKEKLEKENVGKFVAIEVESKDYFIGVTQTEATLKAKKKYPDKIFYMVKIGFPAVITMSSRFIPTPYGSVL